jgi:predicted Ser/Thr protein kinase
LRLSQSRNVPPIPEKIGRYSIVDIVGKGGMGVLYRAQDTVLERDVALKMMLVDFSHDAATRERFQREARAVARLQHRNVVTIHELGEVEGTPYIVMELLGGRDLDALLKSEVQLTLVQKLEIAAQLCEGLAYAHEQGIVHRDIKPGNVRVLEDGTVKILDFGIAKFAQSSVTQTGSVLGTPSYMAPEQIMGQPVDGRSDLFSAGVLLYELLSGTKPFQGDSPTAVVYQIMNGEPVPLEKSVADIPEAINQIVAKSLQKNPEHRYAKAKEMASDLQMVRAMLDPPLHSGHTPIAGMTSGGTTMMSVPLYATQQTTMGSVTRGVAMNAEIRSAAVDAAAEFVSAARPEEKGKSTIIWVGGAVVAVVLGVFVYLGLSKPGADDADAAQKTESSAPGNAGAAAGAAAGAELLVVSTPSGASITLNGADTGKVTPAPLALASLPVGSTLELALKGYKPVATKVTDAELKAGRKEIRFAADARPVRVTVTGTFPFELVQAGQVISAASMRHELTVNPAGAVTARSREMLLSSPVAINFERATADVTLPAPGAISIFAAVETCSVGVDGQDLGFPPIAGKRIASGSHTVTLTCPDGKGETRKVTVAPGEKVTATFGPPKVSW